MEGASSGPGPRPWGSMSSPAGPRPGLAPLSRDAPSLRAARKDPSVPSRRCHRAACEDGHTFQPPVPPPGSKSRKAARRSRLPSAQRGGVRGPLSLCPWPGWPGSPSSLCLEHPFGLGLHCFLPLAPCLSRGLRCECVEVQGGCGSHCGGRGAAGLWARAVRVDCDSCSFSAPSDSQVRCGSGRQAGLTVRPVDSTQRHVTATT